MVQLSHLYMTIGKPLLWLDRPLLAKWYLCFLICCLGMPGIRQLRRVPIHQIPLKLFKLASPKPAYPALSIPSSENHSKDSFHISPSPLLPPGPPWCFPMRPWVAAMPPVSRELWANFFHDDPFHYLCVMIEQVPGTLKTFCSTS